MQGEVKQNWRRSQSEKREIDKERLGRKAFEGSIMVNPYSQNDRSSSILSQ